jgi:hypothetical protein
MDLASVGLFATVTESGHAVAQECSGFDSQWGHCLNPYGRIMALGSTEPLTEMSKRNIFLGVKAAVCRAENLTSFMCQLSLNLGPSTSRKPQDLSRPLQGLLDHCESSKFIYVLWRWRALVSAVMNLRVP